MKYFFFLLIAFTLTSCVSTKSTLKNIDNTALRPLVKDKAYVITEYATDSKYGYDQDYPINIGFINEKQEDILAGYMTYLNKISDTIEMADKKLKEVDHRGVFKSDDEIGFIFEQIKTVQTILNAFIIKEIK